MSKSNGSVVTIPCRLAFPEVFTPKAAVAGGRATYSVSLLFAKNGQSAFPQRTKGATIMDLRRAAFEACVAKWGQDRAKWPATLKVIDPKTYISPTGKDGWPFRDGDLVSWEGYKGTIFIRASSKHRPGVVDARLQPIMSESDVFGGLIVQAHINAYAYDTNGNRGVTFGLDNLFILHNDGTVYSGRPAASDVFEAAEESGVGEGSELSDDAPW